MIDPVLFRDYKGRPYTKVVPFAFTNAGAVAGQSNVLWTPRGAYFELALLLAKSTAAGDYNLCDTNASNIIGFIQFDGVNYSRFDLGLAGIRSNHLSNASLIIVDPVGVIATIKGAVYGWEVTQEGNYR